MIWEKEATPENIGIFVTDEHVQTEEDEEVSK